MLPPAFTARHLLVIDVEATCDDAGAVPRHEMEIIEIGAVMQDAKTFEIAAEFQTFVRPVRHPILTEFCTRLTTIEQRDVADAPAFPNALRSLTHWSDTFDDPLFCSWGDYDRKQFQRDCEHHGVPYPFGEHHLNLKAAVADAMNLRRSMGLGQTVERLGLAFDGTAHRGLDDARNIAHVVRWIRTGT